MPEKRLLFLIDGEIGVRTGMDKEWLSYYVDYFVLQAYGGMSDWRIEGVFRDMDDWIQQGIITPEEIVRRTITTENFESYASTGGGFLSTMANYIYKGTYNVKGETVNIAFIVVVSTIIRARETMTVLRNIISCAKVLRLFTVSIMIV